MLSIDEAIANAREVAAIQRNNDKLNKTLGVISPYYKADCIKCAEEHEQLAEWLEELKAYRVHIFSGDMTQEMLKEQYNKAIDDFIRKCEMESRVILDEIIHLSYYGLSTRELQRIAEQLKAGVRNKS